MNIKRVIREKLDDLFNKVDSKLLEYIDRFIKEDMTDIEKALVIYLCLGDVLYYSPLFSLSYAEITNCSAVKRAYLHRTYGEASVSRSFLWDFSERPQR